MTGWNSIPLAIVSGAGDNFERPPLPVILGAAVPAHQSYQGHSEQAGGQGAVSAHRTTCGLAVYTHRLCRVDQCDVLWEISLTFI